MITPAAPQTPREPGPLRSWWKQAVEAVSADLAVHGLAYLGVLLVFAGVFGFVAFAFGDVQVELRPLAELAMPLTFFVAAWALRRRGIHVVGAALELLGGAILPLVVIASLSDGASVPPDLTGVGLVVLLAAALALVSGLYAFVTLRRPDSPLRFLAAPTAWLAIAAIGLLFAPSVPTGSALSHPYPGQWATVSALITLTLALCIRRRPTGRATPLAALLGATTAAAMPAVAISLLLVFVSAPAEGWPIAPIAAAGLATVLSLELLSTRPLELRLVTVLQGLALYATALMLGPPLSAAWTGTIAVVGAVALFEWQQRRRPAVSSIVALSLWVPGVIVGLVCALMQPVPTIVAWSSGWAWAVVRRTLPGTAPLPSWIPVTVIAVAPVAMASGVGRLTTYGWALFALAALVFVVAFIVRLATVTDELWAQWIPSAAMVVWVLVIGYRGEQGLLVVTSVVLAVAFAAAPRWPVLRVWTTALAASTAFWFAALAWSWSPTALAMALSATGITLVGLASWRREPIVGHVGLIGLLAAMVAATFTTTPLGWAQVVAIGVAVVGWLVTTVLLEGGRSTIGELLERMALSTVPPPPPPSPGAVGLPVATISVLPAGPDRSLMSTTPPLTPDPAPSASSEATEPQRWITRAARAVPAFFATLLSLLFLSAAVELGGLAPSGSARNTIAILIAVVGAALLAVAVGHRAPVAEWRRRQHEPVVRSACRSRDVHGQRDGGARGALGHRRDRGRWSYGTPALLLVDRLDRVCGCRGRQLDVGRPSPGVHAIRGDGLGHRVDDRRVGDR